VKTFFIALKAAACTVIAALLFGWVILQTRTLDPKFGVFLPAWAETPGIILTVAGGVLVLWCFGIFVVVGRGTPSPLDPPAQFVAVGPYRYVRNPIHIGQVILFTGLGLCLSSVSILLFALAWLLFCHLYVVYVEEPSLKRKFGTTYEKYFSAVHRWVPNIGPGRKEQRTPVS
jgi:protein-S-isoprenylcysteine O-methyltransferase Ste14